MTALVLLSCFFSLATPIAGGGPSLTASAIVAAAESGSHILRVDGYSLTKGLGNGKYVASEAFAAGGHSWRLLYYPDSLNSSDSDWISVVLLLDRTDLDEVKARFTISLLDQGGSKVPSHSTTSTPRTFTARKGARRALGYRLVRRNDLERSVWLKDDCFSVRCDITVAKEIFTMAVPPGCQCRHPPPSVVAGLIPDSAAITPPSSGVPDVARDRLDHPLAAAIRLIYAARPTCPSVTRASAGPVKIVPEFSAPLHRSSIGLPLRRPVRPQRRRPVVLLAAASTHASSLRRPFGP
nr:BTB/POZ and MATH domain-containing protein 5-like [Aegilops tauschii subsp. strangulata]